MPVYKYYCDRCDREVTLTLTISQHEKGKIECPRCGRATLRPLLSAFMSQTSKKS
jgi:putative FmdB family regulatory protein